MVSPIPLEIIPYRTKLKTNGLTHSRRVLCVSWVFLAGFIHSVYAAVENTTVDSLVNAIITGILKPLTAFLFVLATVIFLWGVILYVVMGSQSDQKIDKGKKVMTWGIVGMFVMASAWGIIKVLCEFFGSACPNVF